MKDTNGRGEWERRKHGRTVSIELQQGDLVGLASTQQITLKT
jgi:hypothetical protein